MIKIIIVKKNDIYSSEYDIGDVFEITGTWYGGAHINGKSGIPISLDRDEYVELGTESEVKKSEVTKNVRVENDLRAGDIVQHFKREGVSNETSEYVYKILAFAEHTETGEELVIYQALYAPFKIYARPYSMFMGKVDREKYPNVKQVYRFEKWNM